MIMLMMMIIIIIIIIVIIVIIIIIIIIIIAESVLSGHSQNPLEGLTHPRGGTRYIPGWGGAARPSYPDPV